MNWIRSKKIFLPIIGLLLILAACAAPPPVAEEESPAAAVEDQTPPEAETGEGVEDAVEGAAEEESSTENADSEAAEGEETMNDEETADTAAPLTREQEGAEILTTDDRSSRLASITSSWNTNWERRLINTDELLSGGPPRDGIPSIDDPQFISFGEAEEWLADNEPVIALEVNGDARAYPLQIMTWHEIANDTVGGVPVVVTFCPLCNSALVFDRRVDGETLEFGVSGLLRNSDLVMYDRTTETLWQQFTGDSLIGDLVPKRLNFLSTQLISFADFKNSFPDGIVLSRETGFNRAYGNNPYAGYDTYQHPLSAGGNLTLFAGEVDGRLGAADRVVTLSLEEQGIDIAYPLAVLSEVGVIHDAPAGIDVVVFHKPGTASALGSQVIAEAADVGATGVFNPIVDGQKLTFSQEGEQFVDAETGSTWDISGQAVDGELSGTQLEPIIHANHFWFSWAAFKPDTIIYSPA
ncbi:MAG: DUF3179 domain-containing protein [Ardenticatenaceae bacterium]|nr:DUF3179 domain-containing protein [Ardenticatenaceae bacterium]